jgi:hypothetical protein
VLSTRTPRPRCRHGELADEGGLRIEAEGELALGLVAAEASGQASVAVGRVGRERVIALTRLPTAREPVQHGADAIQELFHRNDRGRFQVAPSERELEADAHFARTAERGVEPCASVTP